MDPNPELTSGEIDALRRLIPYADQLEQEAKYRAARLLLLTTWRQSVITIASVIAALALFREQIVEGFKWLVR